MRSCLARAARLARVACLGLAAGCASDRGAGDDWPVAGGDPGNTRYSALEQINTANVATLRVAWTFHTGDLPADGHGEMQATPIVVGGVLYATTPALAVIALRADSGTLLWRFDPFARRDPEPHVNRGVVYWANGGEPRVFVTAGRRLYALDARTGRTVLTFGDSGAVDLRAGLSRDPGEAYVVATSPGVVYDGLLIQGTRVGEEEGSAPGDVRAYDARTGALRWTFHTIPHPGETGSETWPPEAWRSAGGANSWAGFSVDTARGIVYVPTGSATPDFYGGDRAGMNLFANSLLALDARTGRRLWHFQTVHHDVWDRDLPAPPNFVTVRRGLRRVDAVAQITKTGFVFLFDRASGRPLFEIEERGGALPSDLAAEHLWPTQPVPTKPAPFARQQMNERDVTQLSVASHDAALARYKTLRTGLFTPPSLAGTVVLPGFDGGGEWGGAAVDPQSGVLFVNASDVPWIAAMRPASRVSSGTRYPATGESVYRDNCATCHGGNRAGADRAPSLVGIANRLTRVQAEQLLRGGRGFMPSFAAMSDRERGAVLAYLGYSGGHDGASGSTARRPPGTKAGYEFAGYERWRDSSGYPAIVPPWGTLSAIDLNTGEYRWRITLGEHDSLTARGVPVTGTEQYGGPIVTRGGLVFIAATQDARFRALDARTGAILWQARLPAPGFATPSTYAVRGTQYVVVAAGGGKLGAASSDAYVAFSLP